LADDRIAPWAKGHSRTLAQAAGVSSADTVPGVVRRELVRWETPTRFVASAMSSSST
jgi:hypothetical protein